MSKKILGIDIGADVLTAVMLKRTFKGFTLLETFQVKSRDIEGFNIYSDSHGTKDDCSFFESALHVLKEKMNMEGCSVSAVSISPVLCSFRNICVPFVSETKIRQILGFELSVHLPLNHVDYLSDFSMAGMFEHDNEGKELSQKNKIYNYFEKNKKLFRKIKDKNFLLTISIPVDVVDDFFTPLENSGYRPSFMTSAGYSAASYILEREKDVKDSIILDLGENYDFICIACNRKIVKVRCLQKQRDDLKRLVFMIHQTLLGFIFKYDVCFVPEICFISSANEVSDSFNNELEQEFSCSVVHVNLTDYIDMPSFAPDFQPPPDNAFINAVSAAVLSTQPGPVINLCTGIYSMDAFFHKYRKYFATCLIFFLFAAVFLFFNILTDTAILEKEIHDLNTAASKIYRQTFPENSVMVDPLMQMEIKVREIEKKALSAPGNAGMSGVPAIEILRGLAVSIADDINVEISRLLLANERLVISGTTDNFNNVDRIKKGIEGSDLFYQAKITSAAADKNGTLVRFSFDVGFYTTAMDRSGF